MSCFYETHERPGNMRKNKGLLRDSIFDPLCRWITKWQVTVLLESTPRSKKFSYGLALSSCIGAQELLQACVSPIDDFLNTEIFKGSASLSCP